MSLVNKIYNAFSEFNGIEVFVAEWKKRPSELLSVKVEELIAESDIAIAIWTHNLEKSIMGNQEIGYFKALNKPIFPFVSRGMNLKGFLSGFEYIDFDPYDIKEDLIILVENIISFAKNMGFHIGLTD